MSHVRTPEANRRHGVDAALWVTVRKNRLQSAPWWNRDCTLGDKEGLFNNHLQGSEIDFFSAVRKSPPIQHLIQLCFD